MLENLTKKLDAVFQKLRGRGVLTRESILDALRDVRFALLEADVHFKVAKSLIENIQARAVGQEIQRSLTPGQQVVKIVWEELRALLGEAQSPLKLSPNPPTVFMLVGLQGSGKTTTAAKLARHYKRAGKNVLLVAADLQRPAAVEQLRVLGAEIEASVEAPSSETALLPFVANAMERGRSQGFDLVILDTAGRLHVNDELMDELQRLRKSTVPHEVLLVADSMTGQDAVNIAEQFNRRLEITGVILTKTEGDARGGAVLSIRQMTGAPIKFIGTGERLDALEVFHPDRMASRILGMGDVLSLIEKTEEAYSKEQAEALGEKLKKSSFTLEDFKGQIQQIKKIGSLDRILEMIPGGSRLRDMPEIFPDRELLRVEAMINSMTTDERRRPEIINGSRRKRIARGSGTQVQDVNRLLKQFHQAKRLMKTVSSRGKGFDPRKMMPF
jgi:signal recognition particle subunit SRP54